ncbi:MAG TPA: sugar ABC transporter ATP-binding protein [Chthoniobacterales bacterium]|jgi:ribose transport system ATP-binding protein/rhamnose transport system ATP-binding protein|nr:sugar ABC transporter ATP-binding protein [Chthoniobacterales bacterium]
MLVAVGIDKAFDRTRALAGAELDVYPGEIMGLLGANGAGKSTLSKVISGHVIRDAGSITFQGRSLSLRTAREAIQQGITMVMQETSLAPDLSVLENVFLAELGRPGRLSYRRLKRQAEQILDRLGQKETLPLDREVRLLSAAQRQLVEIAKALALNSTLIIFDEPTASLSPPEVERLFQVMITLKRAGHTLVFVSHRLEEVFAITDRVTVMREGRTVAKSLPTGSLSQAELIRLMAGQEVRPTSPDEIKRSASRTSDPVVLEVTNLSSAPGVRDVSFKVHQGEILGLGGLVGAGRSETVEAIFGLRPRQRGELFLNGKRYTPRRAADAIRAGIGFVAEDRRVQGIVPDFSVRENLLLGHLAASRKFGLGYSHRKQKVDELIQNLGLPAQRLDTNLLNFSGGMQQKIIIARWLLLEPSLLLLDEPTKGVDIGTRTSIYAMLRQVAETGVGVVVISSDFEELLRLCERIVVMSDGSSIANVPSGMLNEEKLTLFAAPRTSMEKNSAFLRDIARDLNGAAFWTLIDQDRLFCLYAAVANDEADPGFRAADTPMIENTRIPTALSAKSESFVIEPNNQLATLLFSVRSRRGHDMGWVGVTLDSPSGLPSALQLREQIETFLERIMKSQ